MPDLKSGPKKAALTNPNHPGHGRRRNRAGSLTPTSPDGTPGQARMGPATSAGLTERQSQFVATLTSTGCTPAMAAKLVGYHISTAHHLMSNPRVLDAIKREREQRFGRVLDLSTNAIAAHISNPEYVHKLLHTPDGHADPKGLTALVKAAQIFADRAGYAPAIRYAEVRDDSGDRPKEEWSTDQLRAAINGLEVALADAEGRLIEGSAESVDGQSADVEGLER